jgi:O-acetyl-ADP-ribose deacetylase (regulator of RNase III)
VTLPGHRLSPDVQLDVTIDDLAFVAADAIARPVNALLGAPTALMRRVEEAAGPSFASQLHVASPLDVGAAVVTGGGALQAPLVIHAVVMTDDEPVSRAGIMRATTSTLQRAHDWRIARLAVAPFGLGAGNLDVDESAQAMIAAIAEHRNRGEHPAHVTIVVENDYEAEAFRAARALTWGEE